MEKGKIKIHKSGKIKKCTNSLNKGVSVPAIFDFSQFCPIEGTKEFDCELEVDEKGRAIKIIINGIEVDENKALKKSKEDKEKYKGIKEFKKDNFVDLLNSFIPMDTSEVLSRQKYIVDNFNLELNKLPRYDEGRFQFFKTNKNKIVYQPKQKFSEDLINQISKNEQSTAKSLFKNNASFESLNFKPNWRMVVGLGGESVYETSITLHHIYGIPYIPASSIKGVVRSWIINTVFGDSESEIVPLDEKQFSLVNAEFRAYQDESFCYAFGCPSEFDKVIFENGIPKTQKRDNKEVRVTKKVKTKLAQYWVEKNQKFTGHIGKLVFLDAFPTTDPKIEVDIMNPHYPEYYSGNKPPTDTQNPVPIPFLTVAKTNFQFIVGTKGSSLQEYKIDNRSIDDWLKEALSVHGIGAKTAVGYGRLLVP